MSTHEKWAARLMLLGFTGMCWHFSTPLGVLMALTTTLLWDSDGSGKH